MNFIFLALNTKKYFTKQSFYMKYVLRDKDLRQSSKLPIP